MFHLSNFGDPKLPANEKESSASERRRSSILAILVLAVVYAAAGRFGLLTAIPPGYVTAIWPSSGIALAAILLYGNRLWPGIWLGSFAVNNWVYISYTNKPPSVVSVIAAALIAVGASTAALSGGSLLRRITSSQDIFSRTSRVVGFFGIGVLGSCLISATIGSTSLGLTGLIPWTHFPRTWWTWWLGDAAGVLVITPLLLTWAATRVHFQRWRAIEALVLLVLLIATCSIAFGYQRYPLSYIVLPVLIAAALRFREVGAATAIALAFFIGTLYTIHGRGPFAPKDLSMNESLLLLGSFMLLTGFTTLILAAVWSEREQEARQVALEKEHTTSAEYQRDFIHAYATTIEAENLRKTKEFQEAAELQLSMLPSSMPELAGLEVAAHMDSTSEVGGDYYDILPMRHASDSQSYLFCVADVAGKGLVASLLMSNFQSVLLTLMEEPLSLAEIACRLSMLLRAVPRSRYITSIMVQLDTASGLGTYVNAGHTSGILLRAEGHLDRLVSTGFPFGMFANLAYNEDNFQLWRGDLVALFSDGFIDAVNPTGEEFGEARLIDYLCRARYQPAKDIVAGAFDEIKSFVASAPQFDDITLLVLKSTA